MNLIQMRKLNRLWQTVAKDALKIHSGTALADQDIFNALIKYKPEILYSLPCAWNVQLGDHTLSDQCYENYDVKVCICTFFALLKY